MYAKSSCAVPAELPFPPRQSSRLSCSLPPMVCISPFLIIVEDFRYATFNNQLSYVRSRPCLFPAPPGCLKLMAHGSIEELPPFPCHPPSEKFVSQLLLFPQRIFNPPENGDELELWGLVHLEPGFSPSSPHSQRPAAYGPFCPHPN